ncbi:MAG: hypothetical protein K9J75_01035 [Cyanobium usitatum Tobar12.5m-G36]|nr:hypothetical protein [Cyanobium usitatum Tobar12.5m-G36]
MKQLRNETEQLRQDNRRLAELESRMDALLRNADSCSPTSPATGSSRVNPWLSCSMNSGRQKPETACCASWNRPVFARYRYHPQPQRSAGNAPGSAFEGLAPRPKQVLQEVEAWESAHR